MKRTRLSILVMLFASLSALAQFQGDVLGSHNLAPNGASPVQGSMSASCLYCHAPHSGIGGNTPLWGHTLSSQTYSMYTSQTTQNIPVQPVLGDASSLCLSCHDGTVAVGQLVPYGTSGMTGNMATKDVFGS